MPCSFGNDNKMNSGYYYQNVQRFESVLNSKSEQLATKIKALVQVWNCIGQCNLTDSDSRFIIHIIDWAKLHTLNVVLTGEWKKYKDDYETKLIAELEKTQNELKKINQVFSARCQKLTEVIKNPWNHPILDNLLKTPDAPVGRKEIEFFSMETAYLVSVRLKKLCESQCEDLALNLVSAYMKCYNLSESEKLSLNATDTQMWFIFDIYVMLLHKFKELNMLLSLLKGITLEEGLSLIRRFYKKRVKISKVWKNSARVAHLASQIFILSSVTKPIEESGTILKDILDIWLEYNNDDKVFDDLCRDIRRIIDNVVTASHIYVFADAVHRKIGLQLKAMIIELYVRALTTDMNDLEIKKTENNDEKVKAITERLAAGFCSLANVLEDNVKVSRECVLTAFSLDPTMERLKRIEDLARKSGFQVLDTGQDWKCKLHPPALPSDELVWICKSCNDWMCKPQLNVPLNTNLALHEALTAEHLGLSPQLCDDLVVVLSCPRYQVLSWLVDWCDLHRLCIMYLNDPQSTKNLVTELKFVDIDYAMFDGIKREPVDELAGIEKGYEQYLDQNYSDEQLSTSSDDGLPPDCRLSLGSSDCGEASNYLPLLPPPKSDPKTLKSLRMFRPNLKRSRYNQSDSAVPEKIFRSNESQSLLRQTIITPSTSGAIDYSTTAASSSTIPNTYASSASSSYPVTSQVPTNSFQYSFLTFSAGYMAQKGLDNDITEAPDSQLLPYDLSTSRSLDPKNGKSATLPLSGVQVAKEKEQILNKLSQPHTLTHCPAKDKKPKQPPKQKQNKKSVSSNKKHHTLNIIKDLRVQVPRISVQSISSLQKNATALVKKQPESTITSPQTVTKIQNPVPPNSSSLGDQHLNQSVNGRNQQKVMAFIEAPLDSIGTQMSAKKVKNSDGAASIKESNQVNFKQLQSARVIKEKIAQIACSNMEKRCQQTSKSDTDTTFCGRSNNMEHTHSMSQSATKDQNIDVSNGSLHSVSTSNSTTVKSSLKIGGTQTSSSISDKDDCVFQTSEDQNTQTPSNFLNQNQEHKTEETNTLFSTKSNPERRPITRNLEPISVVAPSKEKEKNSGFCRNNANAVSSFSENTDDHSVVPGIGGSIHANTEVDAVQSRLLPEKLAIKNTKQALILDTKLPRTIENDTAYDVKDCNANNASEKPHFNILNGKTGMPYDELANREIFDNYEIVCGSDNVRKRNKYRVESDHKSLYKKICTKARGSDNVNISNPRTEKNVINGAKIWPQLNKTGNLKSPHVNVTKSEILTVPGSVKMNKSLNKSVSLKSCHVSIEKCEIQSITESLKIDKSLNETGSLKSDVNMKKCEIQSVPDSLKMSKSVSKDGNLKSSQVSVRKYEIQSVSHSMKVNKSLNKTGSLKSSCVSDPKFETRSIPASQKTIKLLNKIGDVKSSDIRVTKSKINKVDFQKMNGSQNKMDDLKLSQVIVTKAEVHNVPHSLKMKESVNETGDLKSSHINVAKSEIQSVPNSLKMNESLNKTGSLKPFHVSSKKSEIQSVPALQKIDESLNKIGGLKSSHVNVTKSEIQNEPDSLNPRESANKTGNLKPSHVSITKSEIHSVVDYQKTSKLPIETGDLNSSNVSDTKSEIQTVPDSLQTNNLQRTCSSKEDLSECPQSLPALLVKLTRLNDSVLNKYLRLPEVETTQTLLDDKRSGNANEETCRVNQFAEATTSLENLSTHVLNTKMLMVVSSGSTSSLSNVTTPSTSGSSTCISLDSKSNVLAVMSTEEKLNNSPDVFTHPKNSTLKTYFNKLHGNKIKEKPSFLNGTSEPENNKKSHLISRSIISGTSKVTSRESIVSYIKSSTSSSTLAGSGVIEIGGERVFKPPSHVETLICEINKKNADDHYNYLQSLKTPVVSTDVKSKPCLRKDQIVKMRTCVPNMEHIRLRRLLNMKRNLLLSERARAKARGVSKYPDTTRVISSVKSSSVSSNDCFQESAEKNYRNVNFRENIPKCSSMKTEKPQDTTDKTAQKNTKAMETTLTYQLNQRETYRRVKTSYKRRLKHFNLQPISSKTCEMKKPKTDVDANNCETVPNGINIDAHKSLSEYNLRKRKRSTETRSCCKSYVGSYKTYNKICNDCVPVKIGKKRLVRKKSENDSNSRAPKRVQKYQLSPLQDINPRIPTSDVIIKKQDKKMDEDKSDPPSEPSSERLGSNLNSKSVLSSVPGLKALDMIQPGNVDHIVNVVQISGGRATSTVTSQNSQTSTQVSPHIQRIGQPRVDKPEQLNNADANITITSSSITNSTISKPTTSQSSALINILSQQIIRPSQSNCVRTRPSPLINILSQQIIKPANNNNQNVQKQLVNTTLSQETLVNNFPKTITSEPSGTPPASKNSASAVKTVVTTASSGQGTILQLICKSTLPKFQQAFGKSVYQNSTESTEATSTSGETPTTSVDTSKKPQIKNSSVNIQPIQGGVIYTRQMPVGQTINLLPPGRGQVFRIATSNPDQISLVKDTVIHSKMSALLAAALQGKQKSSDSQSEGDASNDENNTRVAVTARPALLQNTRIVKPVLQIPSNVIRTSPQSNLSSTTLEQLREFDMVYKQIKERSSTGTPAESNASNDSSEAPQRISVTYLNQGQKYTQLSPVVVVSSYCNLQPAASPALSVTSQGSSSPCVTPAPTPSMPKVSSKNSKGKTVKNTTTHTSKASPIPKPQQKPQEDEHTTQRIFDILAEYAEQLRNSPDLNNKPAPRRRSNPPTNPSQNSKRKKSSGSKKTGQCSSVVSDADLEDHRTVGSEDSSCGVVQLSVPEEEQQLQTTTESNDSNSSTRQQLILAEAGNSQTHNLIIAEPTVGEALKMPNTAVLVPGNYIMPVSMVKGGQQIAVVSGGSKILATVPARSGPNMLLFQSFLNQNKKTGVPTVKYSTIQPISGISPQNLSNVNAQPPVILPSNSHSLTAVTLGQPITLKKVDEADKVNTELLLTISQPRDSCNSSSENRQPNSSSAASNSDKLEFEETVGQSKQTFQKSIINTPIATPVIAQTACNKDDVCMKNGNPGSQSSTLITLNLSENKNKDNVKLGERVQSVLVTACTSNGPMLSHTPPRYRKPENTGLNHESNKEEFMHNGEKQNNHEPKQFQSNTTSYYPKVKKPAPPQKLERELLQLSLQRKQAALERELRLQKSLSEECEDLGVDEPSTSDLFPEADLLFDSNHSPSFDQCSHDLVKKAQDKDEPAKASMTLFSDEEDDDNSGSLRTDFLFEPVEYQTTEAELEYDRQQQLTNGQGSTSTESGSSGEDNTLLQNCASMSDVTLNSPISCEYDSSAMHKYKFKYTNRKKGERAKQNVQETWTAEVSSSEDTTGSTELVKQSGHHGHTASCDEDLSDGSYKVVHVAISKGDLLKDDESCEELHCDEVECMSGRGARRTVKKQCSCCNGQEGAARKRPASRPQTPAMQKKALINKKR